ncbi:2,3-dihydro-2,3-dihydroxybenzoate dehydrogenase [Colwellia sp. UCD-KL20]|uniref:2,3-dihydro-2,3-dihydroxybenzoate dehydrogenase n=1 Tax=Colwellia sp. UCD-KL20 TaxID=1917165 RepID=UPI000970D87F|nr:2,3-dihydro-2,3-dihydroxybenzoate dehydrogenase [Colwellia sp. UCD-KL20]
MYSKLSGHNDWQNKIVWVTGANQGIGAETAKQFQQLGAKVIGFDREFSLPNHKITQVVLDISDEIAITDTCKSLLKYYGRVDILVNIAGVLEMGDIMDLTTEQWTSSFNVNVSGAFHLMRQVIPQMKLNKEGVIVNISSNATHMPRMSMGAYSASKAALTNLTLVAGIELAKYGIRCNVISPGSTQTPMQWSLWNDSQGEEQTINGFPEQFKPGIPLGKLATPEDIADTVIFLCSPNASHITLQDIVIDGGATLGK